MYVYIYIYMYNVYINWVDFYIELYNIIDFVFENLSHQIIISSYKFEDMFMYFPP